MRPFYLLLFLTLGLCSKGWMQNKNIDVKHYRFEIAVNDTTDVIKGQATITFVPQISSDHVYFDLVGRNSANGQGMKVMEVKIGSERLKFNQKKERVYIYDRDELKKGQSKTVTISYQGVPADGLIISKNKYGQRTFFADNWPERAHNWVPTNDHPSDKATVDFVITAPSHYQVVGNGRKVEETGLPHQQRLTHWKTDLAIPTKVMAIGIADFAVQNVGQVDGIPIQSWVFTANRTQGFKEYAVSKDILPFYLDYIGDYPYPKLANVQSKTRFGGLENASNIFYSESSVYTDSTNSVQKQYELEALMAHETAHQWFGDEASEIDWPHLWLSEGFASYLPDLYFEDRYGEDTLKARLARTRRTVIDFSKTRNTPVVDTTATDPMQLLNPNSYQKGAWVLHMLRRKLGDSLFQKGIRTYYEKYKGKNASTSDFREIMEQVSGENLSAFFKQWLYTPGQPYLKGTWHYNSQKKSVILTLEQQQKRMFKFPLKVKLTRDDKMAVKKVSIGKRTTEAEIRVLFKPQKLSLDPNINLLFEGYLEKD